MTYVGWHGFSALLLLPVIPLISMGIMTSETNFTSRIIAETDRALLGEEEIVF